MNRLSIKYRVTLWYTAFALLIAVIAIAALEYDSRSAAVQYYESSLKGMMHFAEGKVAYTNGVLTIQEEELYDNPVVNIAVYSENGLRWYGKRVNFIAPFMEDTMQTVEDSENATWYLYDRQMAFGNGESVWVRAYVSEEATRTIHNAMETMIWWLFPVLIVLAATGGWLLTSRAFRPIQKIAETAKDIAGGDDLKKRISPAGVQDELFCLASTFDDMLDRLDNAFEHERQFTSDAAHELRTPLAVILAQSDYALMLGRTPDEKNNALSEIRKVGQRLSKLVKQLLMLSRMDSDRMSLKAEDTDLADLTAIVSKELGHQADARGITLHSEPAFGVLCTCDHAMITRMLINLISNAIQYGRENGRVEIELTEAGEYITLKVTDNGIGIAKEDLLHIWERFFRADREKHDEGSGTGLGLPIVKWIAQKHGGTVSADSIPGVGTVITIRIKKITSFT
jgi:signal transduction histidine kinase